jgi:hypothetical protein
MAVPVKAAFRQWSGAPGVPSEHNGGETYLLRSMNPVGESAQLVIGGAFLSAAPPNVQDYGLRLMQDSGIFAGHAPIIMLIAFDVPEHLRDEVDRWYVEEHVPLLLRANGWLRARRFELFRMSEGTTKFTSLAFHQLSNISVLDSQERAFARSTEWRAQLENKGTWFGNAGRWIYECV